VVKIEVFNFRNYGINGTGTTMKTITIKAGDFVVGGNYGGEYTDVYSLPPEELQVTGGDGTIHNPPQLNDGATHWIVGSNTGKVDFKVYWCGQVECWFDKMTVDDYIGNRLFDGTYDFHILDETTPKMFLLTALWLKEGKFAESNYDAVNYVMNVMYRKLRYQALPIAGRPAN
jgi:hypothetical protein